MAAGVRPNKKYNKILYKIMKTPASLQQDNKEDKVSELTRTAWIKESLPTSPGMY